jgi:hypothetical protein
LCQIIQRVRDGRLRTNIADVATLDNAVAALNPTARRTGKAIIRISPGRRTKAKAGLGTVHDVRPANLPTPGHT